MKNSVYARKFVGMDSWVYVMKSEEGYDVYEENEAGYEFFLESFKSLGKAIEYADNLA